MVLLVEVHANGTAQRVAIRKELANRRLVKDDLQARRWRVIPGEIAPGEQWNAHGAEIARRDGVRHRVVGRTSRVEEVLVPFRTSEEGDALIADAGDAGQTAQPLSHCAIKVDQRIALEGGLVHRELDALKAARVEAHAGAIEAQEAGGDEASADDEKKGESYFRTEQDAGQDGAALFGQRCVLAIFHVFHEAARGGLDGWDQRKEQRGEDGGCGSEREDAPVKRNVKKSVLPAAKENGGEKPADDGRDGEPDCGTSDSEQQALDQQLPDEAATGRAEGHARGKLALAGSAAGHEEASKIEAGEEQDAAAHGKRLREACGIEAGYR